MVHFKQNTMRKIIGRKLAVILLLAISGAGAFATLGDGKKKSTSTKNLLLSDRTTIKPGSFSLRSGYNYRGSEIVNSQNQKKYINLNTVITSQKGNTTYIVPLKKRVVVVKLDIGNRQLRRN
jgi:hypothetical protein